MNAIHSRTLADLPALRPSAAGRPGLLRRAFARLGQTLTVYRQRRALLRLDDAALKDIGISRAEALEEGLQPFWREPRSYR